MWHLHTDRPETCLGGDGRREPLARRAAQETSLVVVESSISVEECSRKLGRRQTEDGLKEEAEELA